MYNSVHSVSYNIITGIKHTQHCAAAATSTSCPSAAWSCIGNLVLFCAILFQLESSVHLVVWEMTVVQNSGQSLCLANSQEMPLVEKTIMKL